jgi:hypothetical protein
MHVLIQEGALALSIFLLLQLGESSSAFFLIGKSGEMKILNRKAYFGGAMQECLLLMLRASFLSLSSVAGGEIILECCRTTPPAAIAKES